MKDLFIKKPFAEIKEIKIDFTNDNELRIYCNQWYKNDNCSFCFQIRTHKPTDEWQKGKEKNMIADCNLTIKEVKQILKYMKKAQKRK